MKLLFDHNLSPDLIVRLKDLFPASNHVYLLGLDRADDREVRSFAGSNDFIIVTKDADYSELHSLYGAPPKIVWIRRGNCSTFAMENMLRDHSDAIIELTGNPTAGILTIY